MLSLFRRLEYRELSKIEINGKILDLGGSRKSGYHELIGGKHKIVVVNIDDRYGFDLKFDVEQKFPIKNKSYNAVICLNLLEHIFDYQNVVDESFRILKPRGRFIGAIPFLFKIHPCPNDYFRYTRFALEKIFRNAGYKNIKIKELGTGLFSVLCQLKLGLYRLNFIKKIAIKCSVFLDKILKFIKPNNFLSEKYMPLGYFVIAEK